MMGEDRYVDILANTVDVISELEDPNEGIQQRGTWLARLVTNRALLDSMKKEEYVHGGHHSGTWSEIDGRRHSRGSLSKHLSSTDAL